MRDRNSRVIARSKLQGGGIRAGILTGALFTLFLAGAEGQNTPAPPASPQAAPKVIVLPPDVILEQLSTRSGTREEGSSGLGSILTSAANEQITARKYTVLASADLHDLDVEAWLTQLQPFVYRLAQGAINDESRAILTHLKSLPSNYLIFVQVMHVKDGPGASWNSMTGAITSRMSSTQLQAALISTRTGQVIWKNESFNRKVFRTNDPKFAKFVDALYATLGNTGEGQ
jgi:hypothetical protein